MSTKTTKTKRAHSHYWRLLAHSKDSGDFFCSCGARGSRALTREEAKWSQRAHDSMFTNGGLHSAWHDFLKKFKKTETLTILGKRVKQPSREWKYHGIQMMRKAESWAREWPDHVSVVRVDDDYHASSLLLLIQSRMERRVHGTSVVVIPQCTGEPASSFFLYDSHSRSLIETLTSVRRQQRAVSRLQEADAKAQAREMAALFRKGARLPMDTISS